MTLSIADRLVLSDLVHRYAACVNARRFDDLAELFTTTAQLTVPQPPENLGPCVRYDGRAGVRAAMAALAGVVRTQHEIIDEIYTGADSDATATGAVTGVAHHWVKRADRLTDVAWQLRYADEYRRTVQGWRIARRALTIDTIETRPAPDASQSDSI